MLRVNVGWIEFLIPVTIFLTALFNLFYTRKDADQFRIFWHGLATTFFGLIHGFGFSNYFNMMMAEIEEKAVPLLGFALGIEISQVAIIVFILMIGWGMLFGLHVKRPVYIAVCSLIVLFITLPMLGETFPA